jgi:zona occludens toxin (predicted ATPase)
MNDIPEMWSMRWHALQRNLATRIGADAAAHSAAAVKTVNMQSAAVIANSWLSRARHPSPAPVVR